MLFIQVYRTIWGYMGCILQAGKAWYILLLDFYLFTRLSSAVCIFSNQTQAPELRQNPEHHLVGDGWRWQSFMWKPCS